MVPFESYKEGEGSNQGTPGGRGVRPPKRTLAAKKGGLAISRAE